MIYQSTRNENLTATSTQAVLQGLAPDGGLYIRKELGGFDWRGVLALDTLGMAERILAFLLPDFENMGDLVRRAYARKFPRADLGLQGRGAFHAAAAHHRRTAAGGRA